MRLRIPTKKANQNWLALRADGRIRTGDLILTKDALYRLSYISTPSSLDARLIILHLPSKSKGIFKVYCNFTIDAGEERVQDRDSAQIPSAWMVGRHGPVGEEGRMAPLEKHEMGEAFSMGRPVFMQIYFQVKSGLTYLV